MTDHRHKSHRLRLAICHREHIHTERVLELGLFIQQVADILRIRPLAQLDHDTDTLFGGLIGDVYDIICDFLLHEGIDIV